ncbi:hypothetical protein FHR61_004029 [Xanthomonas arboricola]|uniref:Uncharacterized protein n=1 Tax=Xanthomonas cannabis TaxID=1885674 RepID=A0ABR6JR63_9XANT|nr:hypothetical protein [Xanthomonas cannabis]MBB4595314.1 hypothetical protein [Xanthomonas cannabis]MBB5524138.1 hypothetical protein [Xanthomonas cannabis]
MFRLRQNGGGQGITRTARGVRISPCRLAAGEGALSSGGLDELVAGKRWSIRKFDLVGCESLLELPNKMLKFGAEILCFVDCFM